jgi:prepilin-type N-terminal cleavage/methylation domain-containing protein
MKNINKGFSLIEVVVAVAILAIASVAIMENFSQSLYNIGKISVALDYSYGLKFYFDEALEEYSQNQEDLIEFEDDTFKYLFAFSDPDFLNNEEYVNEIPGTKIKKITATVILKANEKKLTESESYHVFKVNE